MEKKDRRRRDGRKLEKRNKEINNEGI